LEADHGFENYDDQGKDADVGGILLRPEFYETSGVAELIIAKQRNGPTGELPLTFLKQFTRFESRAETKEPAEKVVFMLRARPRVFS
jgi:hypothetical protein